MRRSSQNYDKIFEIRVIMERRLRHMREGFEVPCISLTNMKIKYWYRCSLYKSLLLPGNSSTNKYTAAAASNQAQKTVSIDIGFM